MARVTTQLELPLATPPTPPVDAGAPAPATPFPGPRGDCEDSAETRDQTRVVLEEAAEPWGLRPSEIQVLAPLHLVAVVAGAVVEVFWADRRTGLDGVSRHARWWVLREGCGENWQLSRAAALNVAAQRVRTTWTEGGRA